MSKQKIPEHWKYGLYEVYNHKSAYEKTPIIYAHMEIDHIIPERVILNPLHSNEYQKWKEKYNLPEDFDINGLENLCPSTKEFNMQKSDNGLFDESHAYDGYIIRALITAQERKASIQEKADSYQLQCQSPIIEGKIRESLNKKKLNPVNVIEITRETIKGEEYIQERIKNPSIDKYEKIHRYWKEKNIEWENYGEFVEIKWAIRFSEYEKMEDIPFWIKKLDEFQNVEPTSFLGLRIFYEKLFALFKAKYDWLDKETELTNYFNIIQEKYRIVLYEEASLLFQVYFGEFIRNRVLIIGLMQKIAEPEHFPALNWCSMRGILGFRTSVTIPPSPLSLIFAFSSTIFFPISIPILP